ncbi:hypothetical protein KVR01_011628 [Diaporthe batatas]|uniref:uncharacterized protein n=1 Tax=Diaporthe batatas TaxID=748121 RepID=UPI001D053C89|nr:uncharacterized protein KVR01_011628 [Diaporthe batatas]KAG8158506.1 hypothetical protein KVR01_011628 [Diaporthe batatas]
MGPFDYVVPKGPRAIYETLSQYAFEKPPLARQGLERSLGVGLVVAEGEVHRQQRKMMRPIFGLGRNQRLVPQVWATATVLCQKIEELVSQANGSTIVEVHSLTMATTLDVIGVTTLGLDFESIQHPERSILQAYKLIYPTPENPTTVDRIVGNIFGTILPPRLLFKIPSKTIRGYHAGMAKLRDFCLQHIRRKKQDIKSGSAGDVELREKDILSAIITTGLADEIELLSHVLTIMAAGHDTTAVTLDWALFRLAKHADIQDRLRAEVAQAIGNHDAAPSLDTLNSMKYLHAFLMEVLRFYPPLPLLARSAVEDTAIGGVRIPRGQGVLISPYAINRCRELWGDEAEEFDVGRWESSHTGGAASPYAFSTFSMGPRTCIGKDFALIAIKTLLVTLLRRFRFEEVAPGWHPPFLKDTTLKARGLKIMVSLL